MYLYKWHKLPLSLTSTYIFFLVRSTPPTPNVTLYYYLKAVSYVRNIFQRSYYSIVHMCHSLRSHSVFDVQNDNVYDNTIILSVITYYYTNTVITIVETSSNKACANGYTVIHINMFLNRSVTNFTYFTL